MKLNAALALVATGLASLACSSDAKTEDPHQACTDCCADGLARGSADPVVRQVAPFTPSPEGVAVCPGGAVFVALGGNGQIWRVPESGAAELWTTLPGRQPAGLSCDDQGRLLVADWGADGASEPAAVVLLRDRADSGVTLPADVGGAPLEDLNGVLAVAGVGVFASDSARGIVAGFVERDGAWTASVAASDLPGANGLAYDATSRTLYVALTYAKRVVALAVATDGTLSAPHDAWTGTGATDLPDGVTVDAQGELYVAKYAAGAVVRASDGVVVATVPNPASLAFRGGTLLVTDYKLQAERAGGLYAVALGVCGQ